MNRTAKAFRVILSCLLLLAVSVYIGGYALKLRKSSEHKMKYCIKHADAKIADVEDGNILHTAAAVLTGTKPTENEGWSVTIYTITYKVKDKKYKFKEPALPEAGLSKGAEVKVSYDPNDPSSAYLYLPESRMKLMPIAAVSAVFALLALIRLFSLRKILGPKPVGYTTVNRDMSFEEWQEVQKYKSR